jgi:hypothetical protein
MKLLTETTDISELSHVRLLLESNGIPIFVGNEDAARNLGYMLPIRKYGVFVVYDEQLDDAIKLMADDSHVVEYQIDMEEYRQYAERSAPNTLNKILKATLVVGFFVFVLLYGLVRVMTQ